MSQKLIMGWTAALRSLAADASSDLSTAARDHSSRISVARRKFISRSKPKPDMANAKTAGGTVGHNLLPRAEFEDTIIHQLADGQRD